jgi:FkbM family methyltransferase
MIQSKLAYHFSKIAPYGKKITIKLKNGLKFKVRARTMDKAVLKEVWVNNLYGRHNFEISENDTVIDIGGHIGFFSIYAACKAKMGKVITFEAFNENYKLLKENIDLNKISNITLENTAVGKENGTSRLFLSADNNTGGHSLHLKKESGNFIDIPVMAFDEVLKKYKLEKVDYLKLDCEGAEFDILLNASEESLKKIKKIVMECHDHGNNTSEKMVKFLEKKGFKVIADLGKGESILYAINN